ncbi:MAG: phosphoenolpyruvate--protein phosphotransferase [Desulfovibrionaceae bacterium]|nr:phosphoenolpyruvate--protein phosphotransferase [Desulfovibrionaceae bacterium]
MKENPKKHRILTGVAASSGIAVGRALFINRASGGSFSTETIHPKHFVREEKRLERAVADQACEFENAEGKVRGMSQEQSDLLEAYSMICRDPKLMDLARKAIRQDRLPAVMAWEKAVRSVLKSFEKIDVPYLRERAEDVKSVGFRVAARLRGCKTEPSPALGCRVILAHDLTPADTLALAPENILGLVTEMGGQTSHTGILARGQRLPCVVGVTGLEEAARDGTMVIVDGIRGLVIVNPLPDELASYQEKQELLNLFEARIRQEAHLPAQTEDGCLVRVYGNIETTDDSLRIRDLGGEGIGLYRTEFGYLSRLDLPTEEELYADYTRIVRGMAPDRVVLRTLDIGADKNLAGIPKLEESNPVLGLRSIRLSLYCPDLLRSQCRAILRAAAHGNAAVMFPMVSGLRELRQAKAILEEARRELRERGEPCADNLPVGVMIELPSSVFLAPALAREADFFSIGSNDLTQYILGVDRENKYVSYLYQPLHSAVLQAVRQVAEAARQAGIRVSVCGEMASDPFCLPLLMAMGIDEFSVTPQAIPILKYLIRRLNMHELRDLLAQVYDKVSTETTRRLMEEYMRDRFCQELQFINLSVKEDA